MINTLLCISWMKDGMNPESNRAAGSIHCLTEPFGIVLMELQYTTPHVFTETVDSRVSGRSLLSTEMHC